MSTKFKAEHPGWGRVTLCAISVKEDGTWEAYWEPLRQAALLSADDSTLRFIVDMLFVLDYHTYLELRHNRAKPLFDLGVLPPKACLARMETSAPNCAQKSHCPIYNKSYCRIGHKKRPLCYDVPVDTAVAGVHSLVAEIVDLWRADSYVLLWKPEE